MKSSPPKGVKMLLRFDEKQKNILSGPCKVLFSWFFWLDWNTESQIDLQKYNILKTYSFCNWARRSSENMMPVSLRSCLKLVCSSILKNRTKNFVLHFCEILISLVMLSTKTPLVGKRWDYQSQTACSQLQSLQDRRKSHRLSLLMRVLSDDTKHQALASAYEE